MIFTVRDILARVLPCPALPYAAQHLFVLYIGQLPFVFVFACPISVSLIQEAKVAVVEFTIIGNHQSIFVGHNNHTHDSKKKYKY